MTLATKTRRSVCFNCGRASSITVQRNSIPHHQKVICREARCWRRWWALYDVECICRKHGWDPGCPRHGEDS